MPIRAGSVSMQPTVVPGDRLLIVPLLYGPRIRLFDWTLPGVQSPRHGDLVAVRPPYLPDTPFLRRLLEPVLGFLTAQSSRLGAEHPWQNRIRLRRLIALPGDTVYVEGFIAYVRPAGSEEFASEFELSGKAYMVDLPELPEAWPAGGPVDGTFAPLTLGQDEYFVLADARGRALDSRHSGTLERDEIVGRIVLRYWPFSAFGIP